MVSFSFFSQIRVKLNVLRICCLLIASAAYIQMHSSESQSDFIGPIAMNPDHYAPLGEI